MFMSINRTHRLAKINRTYRSKTINSTYGLVKSTGRTGLQELTERIGSLKLKGHICLLGLTGSKGLQTTGDTGLLELRSTDNRLLQSSFLVLLSSDVEL